jgi:hypothetical protein
MVTVSTVSNRSNVLVGFAVVILVGADAVVAPAGIDTHGVSGFVSTSVATATRKARTIPPFVRTDTTVAGMMSVRDMRRVVVAGVDASVSDGVIVPPAHPMFLHEVG